MVELCINAAKNYCLIISGTTADPAKDRVLLCCGKAAIIRHVAAFYFGINRTALVINTLVGGEHAVPAARCVATRIFGAIRLNDRVYIVDKGLGCAATIFRVGALRAGTLGATYH